MRNGRGVIIGVVIGAACVAAVSLGACSSNTKSGATTSTAGAKMTSANVVVTQANAGAVHALRIGQTMDVELKAASGTNYTWKVRNGYDTNVVTQVGEPTSMASQPGLPGGPLLTTFHFRAAGVGSAVIAIDLQNNTSGEVAETVDVPVSVTK
ncbi:MAG: protease inhibitor I42 family protein [Acidimicrobiia bacterium]